MFFIHWLSRTARRSQAPRQPNRDRTKERRLKLLRLEQRRVLNADFTFVAHGLNLDHVDGDLTVREVSGSAGSQIEFDLAGGSIWQDNGSTGLFAIDNSTPGHSILSVAKADLKSLSSGVSLHAASSEFDLQFDVQSSPLDLSQMQGTLAAEGFGEIQQTAANDHQVRFGDVSLSADQITLSQFHGDEITLSANEIDLTGGADSFSGSTLSVHSAATPNIELGGTSDSVHELNFSGSDITALDASFHRISFEATPGDATSSIQVDAAGADFNDAITPGHDGSLHLTADMVQIDGAISLSGGLIDVTATHAATISATGSLTSHGGDVHVDAGESGTLLDSGRIDVSNDETGGVGGTVHLLGEQVGLFDGAEVNASGHSGGGEILIGGDLHGDNDAIPHAAHTYIGHDVAIHADAIQQGDGGQVVVWSDEVTQVYGTLTARGGALLGDGGLIETSSHEQLIVTRGGDASAASGNAGTWLLDPLNVRIVAAPSTVYLVTEFAPLPNFFPTVVDSEVTAEAIVDQLKTGTTVVISTFNPTESEAGDVIQAALIDVTFDNPGDSATLIINAANDIFINGGINATNGSLNILLEANAVADDLDDTLGDVTINANIDTFGGSFTSTGVNFTSTAATIMAAGGVSITHTGNVNLGAINTGADSGGTTNISGANVVGTINVGEGNVLIDGGNSDLVVMADITATGTIFLLADRDVIVDATVTAGVTPPLSVTAPLDPSADLTITSDANSDSDGGFWLRESGTADARLNAGGNIMLAGAQLFDATANPGGGKISLRIDADDAATPQQQVVAGQDLTIVANFGKVPDAGDIVIDGMMTATDGALTVFFTDTAFLSADQTVGTDLLFPNAVQLTNDVTVTAGNNVTFSSTIDDDGDIQTGWELTVIGPANTPVGGEVLFVGAIGATNGLDALTVTGDGLVDFLSAVTVDGDISVTGTSESGRITFQDAVTTTNGGSVTITNAGLLVTSSSATFFVASDFVQNGVGSTELGADIITFDGNVLFEQGVLLTDAVAIETNINNGNITFSGTIDSEVAGSNEEQTISLGMPTGGTFTISWDPPDLPGTPGTPVDVDVATTADIPFDATAGQVKLAFVTAANLVFNNADSSLEFTEADLNVTGEPGGPFTLTFRGAFRGTNVAEITVDGTSLVDAVAPSSVLTTVSGTDIVAEHNPLTLIAGTGTIEFRGNIGAGFVDVGLGVDGDQTPGNLTVTSANQITFNNVAMVVADGTIDLGTGTNVITNGIDINGPVESITFESRQNQQDDQGIRINGRVTSDIDLSLLATGDVNLTNNGSLFTNTTHSVTIAADSNGDGAGDFRMGELTEINASAGFIDVRAAEVFLGKLITTNENPTDAENPAIRVSATFRSINDINGDANMSGANLVAEQRTDPDSSGAGVVLEAVLGIGATENALETEIASLCAFNHDLSERQVVTLENATGGTFTLTWTAPGTLTGLAETTAAIPFNASADQVKLAFLATFDTLTNADLDVSGNAGGPYLFTFQGALRATNVSDVMALNANLIGSDPTTPRVATVETTTISEPARAENNIVIRDVGTNNGERVDLIFVHNEANQITSQFANTDVDFESAIGNKTTEITFSAATPGPTSNDLVLNFTISQHTNSTTTPPSGASIGVPIITVTGHTINIDLDYGEDLNENGVLDSGEDKNNNGDLDRTTANALRDAINSHHAANQLVRARITNSTSDVRAPGTDDITSNVDGLSIALNENPAGIEDGVININVENGSLRVVADNSRLVLSEMQRGIDAFNPPDLAVAAIQSENTIQLTANTIEVFDDILAISAKTQVTTQTYTQATSNLDNDDTTLTVLDTRHFPVVDTNTTTVDFLIQINSEILAVTHIDSTTNELTLVRGQNNTLPTAHLAGPILAAFDELVTTLRVVDANVFRTADGDPFSPGFFIRIDSETLLVTDIDFVNNELTVERGQSSTTATSHVPGTVIREVGIDTGIRQYIEIQARTNFVLGEDRVISTDDHYLNSLNVAEDLNGNGRLERVDESFTDANGNGQYDTAEPFTDMNGNRTYDLGEPFANVVLDANGVANGVFDPMEPFTDSNGNGKFDLGEDFNNDGLLQFNTGEDLNRNGMLDPGEDSNGDGILQFRGDKPITAQNDDFFSQNEHDVIHITADSTFSGTNGRVLLGENSTISTDNGIQQLISPRPVFTGINTGVFTYLPGTAFFSGNVVSSDLTSRFLLDGPEVLPDGTVLPANSVVFLGTLTFTIGSPGEKNLVLDIDWGDHDRNLLSEIPPITANALAPIFDVARGIYVFNATVDQRATRYLIPEGGATYSIPHEFSQNAFNLLSEGNLLSAGGQAIQQPGRGTGVTSDPIQVRFAVSQHSSIVIDGQAVLDPRVPAADVATALAAVPENAAFDNGMTGGRGVNFPKEMNAPGTPLTNADPLFQLSSTDVLDDPDLFLPRFDNGIVTFSIPTPPSAPIPPADVPIPPPALPSPFIPDNLIIAAPQITTETSRSSAASSSVTTDEYFELRRTNEDGTVTAERLDELARESLLNRENFEKFVRDLGDGEYEIFFITRDIKDGTTIPRSVIQFRLESGRLAPPANDSPNLFKPFKLIPVPKAPKPVPPDQPNNNGADADQKPDASDDGNQKPSNDEMSALPLQERPSDTAFTVSGTAIAAVDSFVLSDTAIDVGDSTIELDESASSESTPLAVGLLMMAGTRRRKTRFNPFGSALFSKTARLARKRVANADDK